jgi:hypothetical protein
MDFGHNVCLGDIGRSHHSLFKQTLVGAETAETKHMALAEHDCLYTAEHFNWIPPDDEFFYYNVHHWFVQWGGKLSGMYSYFRRKPMSMLICNRELYIRAIKEKLAMIEDGYEIRKGQLGACEPGVCENDVAFVKVQNPEECEPGVCDDRAAFIEKKLRLTQHKDVGKETFRARSFKTEFPNIDIRHGKNFSGNRRGRQRCYSIPYWGDFRVVMERQFGKQDSSQ